MTDRQNGKSKMTEKEREAKKGRKRERERANLCINMEWEKKRR